MAVFGVFFRDERRMISIPDLAADVITATAIATHAHPYLAKLGDWQIKMGVHNALGVIVFRKKHVGPIYFTVVTMDNSSRRST